MQLFYAPDVDFSTGRYLLSGEESRHCARVLRLRSGDFVHITDGRGTLCRAEIVSVSPHGCELSLGERTENFEKRSYFLQVAVAPTKNMDRLEWFAEKATEIGIDRITPLLTDHCERRTVKTDRLIRVVTGAVKQSLKAWHPQVDELTPFRELIGQPFDGKKANRPLRGRRGEDPAERLRSPRRERAGADRPGRRLFERGDRPGVPQRFRSGFAGEQPAAYRDGRRRSDAFGRFPE